MRCTSYDNTFRNVNPLFFQSGHRLPSDLLVWSKTSLIRLKPSGASSQALTSAARQTEGSLTTGPLVMLSAKILLRQPPLSCTGRISESANTHTQNN